MKEFDFIVFLVLLLLGVLSLCVAVYFLRADQAFMSAICFTFAYLFFKEYKCYDY